MNPSKRQLSLDENDVSEHPKKKIASSDEQRVVDQDRPTASSSGCTLSAPMEPMTTSQAAGTAEVAIGNPLGTSQYADNDQVEGPHHETTNYSDDILERIALLEKRTRRLEKQRKKLKRRPYDVDIKSIENQRNELQDQLKTAQSQLHTAQGQLHTAQDKLEVAQNELGEVQEQLESANRRNGRLMQDIQLVGIARAKAPDLEIAIESRFRKMRRIVRLFTKTLCDRQISVTPIPDNVKTVLATITGLPIRRLLRSGLHARYLVEGLIWRLFCDNLFENPFLLWGDTNMIGSAVMEIQSGSEVPVPYEALWRSMTGQLLSNRQPSESKINSLNELLVSHIKPLVSPKNHDSFERHLRHIVEDAIEVTKDIAQTRTQMVVQRKEPGADDSVSQDFNGAWMEVAEKSIDHYEDIDFVVAPALIQLTDSLGDKHDPPRVIVMAEVCFGEGRIASYDHPTSQPPQDAETEVKTTQSDRQTRAARRLGKSAGER